MSISLAKLRSFIAVADESQFNRAAQRLGVSQPSLSAQIRDLERLLGVSLFNRTTRSVSLTVEGRRFLHRARRLLADLNDAVADMQNLSSLSQGRIVVAATPSVTSMLLPAAIQAFGQRFPDIHVQVHEAVHAGVEDSVISGRADFGFGPRPARTGDLEFTPFLSEKFFGVTGAAHAADGVSSMTFAEFCTRPLILPAAGTGLRSAIDEVLADQGVFPNVAHVLAHQDTMLTMASKGLGVAYLPALVILSAGARPLRLVDVREPETWRDLGVMQRKGGSASAATAEFLRLCFAGELLDPVFDMAVGADENSRLLLEGIALRGRAGHGDDARRLAGRRPAPVPSGPGGA